MRIAGTEITFTFHYVSINTVGGTGGEGGADIFTFHYVSINTKLASIHSHNMRTLHSTMFLLIHGVDSTQAMAGLKTLHSTMFLLIPDRNFCNIPDSISLHSTMFLLIPAPLNHRLILPYYTIFCRPWYFFIFLFISI